MDIEVRKIKNSDKDKVIKIVCDNFSGNCVIDDVPNYIDQYVAVIEDEVVGYFVCTNVKNIVRDYTYYMIDYVCVDVDHQRMGIGKTMMNYIIEEARNNDIKFIQLTSSDKRCNAQEMYKKMGFVEVDTNLYRLVI